MERRGSVYAKKGRLYIAWYDATGKRHCEAAGLPVGEEARARKRLRELQNMVGAQLDMGTTGPVTVAAWGEEWVTRREGKGIASAKDDRQRLRLYINPELGRVPLEDLDTRTVRRFVAKMQQRKSSMGGKLSPRTVLHIYATLRQLCKGAVKEGHIAVSPCTLDSEDLPTKRDKDPEWRSAAVFTREEVELLISHPDIPEVRRLGYALMALGGLRWGEVAALRWRAYDKSQSPLGRLTVSVAFSDRRGEIGRTKTGATRLVPVHPTLAQMLAAWKLGSPGATSDDLILPAEKRETRRTAHTYQWLQADLERLGFRRRRLHDLRRTFISLAQQDGAGGDVLRWITHTPDSADMIASYTSLAWPTLCEAVAKIRVSLRRGDVIELRQAVGAATMLLPPEGQKQKAPKSLRNSGPLLVGDAGLEPEKHPILQDAGSGESAVKCGTFDVLSSATDRPESGGSGAHGSRVADRIREAVRGVTTQEARSALLQVLSELPHHTD